MVDVIYGHSDDGLHVKIHADNQDNSDSAPSYIQNVQHNVWYTNTIIWDKDTGEITLELKERDSGSAIGTYTIIGFTSFASDMVNLGVSWVGHTASSNYTVSYIDNVRFYEKDGTINTPPTASVITPTGTQGGDVPISYTLVDDESDTCSIQVKYSEDGGLSFDDATQGQGGGGTTNLSSSPTGISHVYVWNSVADIGQTDQSDIRIRITPFDSQQGASDTTEDFRVDNTQPSQAPVLTVTPETINDSGYVELKWTEVPGATAYHVQVSLFSTFDPPDYEWPNIEGTEMFPNYPHFAPNTYYYRVRAMNQEKWSNVESVDVVSSTEPTIISGFTCKDYSDPYGTMTDQFSVNDEWVWVYTWWDTEEITVTSTVRVDFWSPNGTRYLDWYNIPPGYPSYYVWLGLSIDNDPKNYPPGVPAQEPGEWRYDILLNLYRVDEGYFQLR